MPDRDLRPLSPEAAVSWSDGEPDLLRLRDALVGDLPEALVARHLDLLTPTPVVRLRPRRPVRRVLRVGTTGAVLAATLAGGVGVAAASGARPGDPLYGLKTARERLQLTLARKGESRAALEVRLARVRLDEAAALFRSGDVGRAVATLARADAALAVARTQGSTDIDTATSDEIDRRVTVLSQLLDDGLPEQAADAARDALDRALTHGRGSGDSSPSAEPGPGGHGRSPKPAHPSPHGSPTRGNGNTR